MSSEPLSRLVDEMLDRYVEWREDADAVAEAYACWGGAPGRDEDLRFSLCMASLELEEASAKTYAAVVAELDCRLRQAERGTGLTGKRPGTAQKNSRIGLDPHAT